VFGTLPIAGFSIKDNEFDGLYVGRQKGDGLVYAGKVDHGFDAASAKNLQARLKPLKRSLTPRKSRTVALGSSRRCLLRSNTGRSLPRARYAIPSSRAVGRIYELARGPMWGTVIVAVLLGVIAAAYFLIQNF
jgi:hypothetical protein